MSSSSMWNPLGLTAIKLAELWLTSWRMVCKSVVSLFGLFWKDFMASCFSLCLACLVSFHWRPVSVLMEFLCCFHLLPCYLTWLVTIGDLLLPLLFFLSVVPLMHLSFEMDWSCPFCYWKECVTLCFLNSVSVAVQPPSYVTSSLVSFWQGK